MSHLRVNSKLGSSWEGFALEEVIRLFNARSHECYFWSTYSGAELDLIIQHKSKLLGFEFKYTDKPSLTKSMKIALKDLKLDHIFVVSLGDISFKMDDKITAHGLSKDLLREFK